LNVNYASEPQQARADRSVAVPGTQGFVERQLVSLLDDDQLDSRGLLDWQIGRLLARGTSPAVQTARLTLTPNCADRVCFFCKARAVS
jgi:hypothetical protein